MSNVKKYEVKSKGEDAVIQGENLDAWKQRIRAKFSSLADVDLGFGKFDNPEQGMTNHFATASYYNEDGALDNQALGDFWIAGENTVGKVKNLVFRPVG